ncbi:MAG: bifunctional (p)ppGpp synthetase/guanosine-3',5'-bis(diphosphate) 3'-pyrophosphohydrolase [Cytophaga sp.]|nr:bifunctional (p)ppGpp synthetase/guanosine-3',5'-bis(diphosphate) 3'-pyrophosphohydrolase [Cytophaga sp.]
MNNNKWSIDEIQNVWQLVSQLHDGQKYGGANEGEKIEYINHIGSVAFEVINALNHSEGMNSRLALTCALLHDSIEDTPFTFEKVKELFGEEIAQGVLALTKDDRMEDKQAKMADSLRRIKEQPKEVWAVKMADRIANLYAPPYYWTDDKKKAYIQEAEQILSELKEGNHYLAERLKSKIAAYHQYLNK